VDNVATTPTEGFNVTGASALTIWVKASISFPTLAPGSVLSTVGEALPILGPSPRQNLFSLRQLLDLADVDPGSIHEDGCILVAVLDWQCFVGSTLQDCYPVVSVRRLDYAGSGAGFNMRVPSTCSDAFLGNGKYEQGILTSFSQQKQVTIGTHPACCIAI
jgi:hypothetical protein